MVLLGIGHLDDGCSSGRQGRPESGDFRVGKLVDRGLLHDGPWRLLEAGAISERGQGVQAAIPGSEVSLR